MTSPLYSPPTTPPTTPTTEREKQVASVTAALHELEVLGSVLGSSDAIGEYLEDIGIRGEPCQSNGCPVAIYVYRDTDISVDIWGDGSWAFIGADVHHRDGVIPPNVAQFIAEFDDEHFIFSGKVSE